MNYQSKGLFYSLIIHSVVLIFIIGISQAIVPVKMPIVIDFSLNKQEEGRKETLFAPLQNRIVKKVITEKVISKERQESEIKPTEDTPCAPIAPTISESQVAVPVSSSQLPANVDEQPVVSTDAINPVSEESARAGYVKEHFTYIRNRIMNYLSYPVIARRMGWEGKVMVSFVICEEGGVNSIKIMQTSGFELIDKNAMETIKKASPFPKPPVRAEIIMPISYRLE